MGKVPEYVDMTPTHKTAARIYVAVLLNENADPEAKQVAEQELIFMGALADERNVFARKLRELMVTKEATK